ncbi:MAG TPA: STAS domain-containing protein [Methylibium sp.]|nr:STAS domain-containing protein [Methylibium sp.]
MELEVVDIGPAVTCVRLDGRLDALGADAIGVRFSAAVAAPGRPAVVDLSGVSFVASMGLRLLISTARALHSKGATLVLFGAQDAVRQVLEEASIDQIIPVAASREQALAQLPS